MQRTHFLATGSRVGLSLLALATASGASGFLYQSYLNLIQPVEINTSSFSFLSLGEVSWGFRHQDPDNSFLGFSARIEESQDATRLSIATFKVDSVKKSIASIGQSPKFQRDYRQPDQKIEIIQAAPIRAPKPETEDLRMENIHLNIQRNFLASLVQKPQEFINEKEAIEYAQTQEPKSKPELILAKVAVVAQILPLPIKKVRPVTKAPKAKPSATLNNIASSGPAKYEYPLSLSQQIDELLTQKRHLKTEYPQVEEIQKTPTKNDLPVTLTQASPLKSKTASPVPPESAVLTGLRVGKSPIYIASLSPQQESAPAPKSAMNTQNKETDTQDDRVPTDPIGRDVSGLGIEVPTGEYPIEAGVSGTKSKIEYHIENLATAKSVGWKLMKTGSMNTTIYRMGVSNEIPVFSENTLSFLSKRAGVSFNRKSAQIYVEHPQGWKVEVSTRNDGSLYWQGEDFAEDQTGAKKTLILNVQPGQAMVYLKSPDQKRSVAIHIPLMSENLTYVYAPRIEETPFEAQIFDAESPTNKALPKVTLQVAGQDTQKTISDELGRANLKSLSYVNGYSTWIDLQMPSGDHPVNRFEVDQRGKQNEFYYFKAPLFKNWTRQLEGGVSSAGGYFVAALGGVSTEPVWAQTTSLIDATHSSAETYSIDRGGFLRVGTPLDEESLRAFGSELQDDLYRLEVLDESRTTLWSKLLFTSPGVLNVIRAH